MRETPTILIIDDDDDQIQMYVAKLAEGTFTVLTAQDGAEGIDIAKDAQPDLILIDLSMPGINGLDVVFQLKDDPATMTMPFVFLTDSQDKPEDMETAKKSGATAIISKESDMELLVERVQEILSVLPPRPE